MIRWVAIGVCALGLSGCAGIPAAVSIASLAADGASWMATGKTVSEHALSEVAGADCKFLGVLEDGEICKETPAYAPTSVATLQPLPPEGAAVAAATPKGRADPMRLPGELTYLAAALEAEGLAVAAPRSDGAITVAAFAPSHGAVAAPAGRSHEALADAGYLGDGLAGAAATFARD